MWQLIFWKGEKSVVAPQFNCGANRGVVICCSCRSLRQDKPVRAAIQLLPERCAKKEEAAVSEARISITELRARFDFYLKQVKAGRELVITKYGKPVARFAPALAQTPDNRTVSAITTEAREARSSGSATIA